MKRQNIFISFFLFAIIFLQIFVECKEHANSDNNIISTLKQHLKVRQEETKLHQIQQQTQQNKINSFYLLPHSQVQSLMDLFYATNGHQWNTNTNWLYGHPCNNLWFGVYCDYPFNTTVLTLHLGGNNLVGTIPTSIYDLGDLNYLDLSNNTISKYIPGDLLKLNSLSTIYLNNNQLSGTIPNFGSSISLINLANNQLHGSIPNTFQYSSSLYSLDISENMITGTIPPLPSSLTYLSLSENMVTGTIPPLPSSFDSLAVSGNMITGTMPPLPSSLTYLDLSKNMVTGTMPPLPSSLSYLGLSENMITGTIPPLPSYLLQLYVSNNQLTGTIPTVPPSLSYADLSNNDLSGTLPHSIFSSNLNTLYLTHNSLSGSILGGFSNLQYIDFSSNMFTGNLPAVLTRDPYDNNFLNISHNQLTGTIPSYTFGIESLFVNNLLDLSHNSFTGSIPNINSSTTLILSYNQLNGTIPSCAFQSEMIHVDLSHNQLTGTLPQSLSSLPNFEILNFAYNSLEGTVPPSYYAYPNLQSLKLENNKITGFIEVEKFLNLTSYNFTNNQFYCPVSPECGEFGNQLCLPCRSSTLSLLETLSTAVLFFIDGNTENATAIVKHACESVLVNDIFASSGLQNISCQWYNNLLNGNNFFGRRENTITKLSWQYYNDLVNDQVQKVLVPYENLLGEFKENIHNYQNLQSLTQSVINYASQEISFWETVVNNATTLLTTEEKLILYFRDELNQILLVDIYDDLSTLQTDIVNQIQNINNEINTIQSQTFLSDMIDIGEVLVGSALALCGLPTEEFVVKNTIQLIGDFFDTLSDAEKITALQDAVYQLEGISNDLENAKNSLYSVAEFYDDISTDEPPPVILPALYLNLIAIESIDQSVDQLADRLIQINDVQELREDVDDLTAITKQFTQAIVNWYLIEMKIQSYQSQLEISQSSADSLTYLLNNEEKEEEGFLAGYFTAFQFKTAATFRILIDMLYLQNQYNYYALSDFSFRLYLPFNPSSQDISNAQLKLYNTIISYVNNAQLPSQITANYTLTADRNNNTFTSLWSTGSGYFVISLPDANLWKEKGYGYYYAVNMISLRAYPYPIVNPRFSTLNIGLTQLGDNLFYDQNAKNWNFTTTIYEYTFIFDANTLCAVSSQYDPQNIDYIHYSPYGIWQIDIPKGQMDVTQITKIELQFTLYLNTNTHQHIPLWGNYPYGDFLIVPPTC